MGNPNILSDRYATPEINEIFSEKGKIKAERNLWVAVMEAQKDLGMDIPQEDIEKFRRSINDIDLELIEEIEKETRHDIKAKIQAFIQSAGAGEYIHLGMTSRDLTDNIEQMQNKKASTIIFGKYVSVLRHLVDKAHEYEGIELTARTHHQPAQPTLLGRRFSMWAEELIEHLNPFEEFIEKYPLRGIKGPVGTQADMVRLLGNPEKAQKLEKTIAKKLGFKKILDSPGQVYPRSLDLKLVSKLSLLSAAPENFAKSMRLMAGYELVTEGFKQGQTGSSAMPHKMNTRSSERICGLAELTKMYVDGASRISGDQWEEGDVSCSVPRRVILSDAFYASDGLCETTLTVLNEMGAYPVIIEKELDRYLPFLATTMILTEAVKFGIGREKAHSLIKRYAKEVALEMREKGVEKNTLAKKLGKNDLFKKYSLTERRLNHLIKNKKDLIGRAHAQVDNVTQKANKLIQKYSQEAAYEPRDIL